MKMADIDNRAMMLAQRMFTTLDSWLSGEPVWSYDKILKEWGENFENNWRRIGNYEDDIAQLHARESFIRRYGFAIPCAELMKELTASRFIVEVGAGSGYMTKLMRLAGIHVVGTDADLSTYGFTVGAHNDKQRRIQAKTAIRRYWKADTVFCSWPSYDHTWFRQMLKAMPIGQRLVVVRESATAEDTAWQYFDSSFESQSTIELPVFYGLHDHVEVAIKRRHGTHDRYKPIPSFSDLLDSGKELIEAINSDDTATEPMRKLGENLTHAFESYEEVRARNGYQQKLAYLKDDGDVENSTNH